MLAYTVGCTVVYRSGRSAAYLCGIFAGMYKMFTQLGKWFALGMLHAVWWTSAVDIAVCVIAAAITVAVGFALSRDTGLIERLSWNWDRAKPSNMDVAGIIERYALTLREASVMLAMLKGEETAQIAEEMFCAQSTVRAHMSNLYRKLGVHSRAELVEMLDGVGGVV